MCSVSSLRFVGAAICLVALTSVAGQAQCLLLVDGDPFTSRTGPNQVRGRAVLYPTTISGSWSVTLSSVLRFTPAFGSEQTVETAVNNFSWSSGTPTGIGSSKEALAFEALELHGNGSYRTREEVVGSCGGQTLTITPKISLSQAIARPSRPDYGQSNRFLTYMGGAAGAYKTTIGANFTTSVPVNPGLANGATGPFTWVLLEGGTPPGADYADLSCTSCSQTTLLAKRESDACLTFNVQVKTSYGGFLSEPLFVSIKRPKQALKPGSPFQDRHDNFGSGYLSSIFYKVRGLCAGQGDLAEYRVNEVFSNIISNVDAGPTNWPLVAEGNFLGTGSTVFADTIRSVPGAVCGPQQNATCIPVPTNPQAPLGGIRVQTASQKWRVGSTTPGTGIVIQTDTIRQFIDHGDHINVVTPSN